MATEETNPTSKEASSPEFYVPATFQFSPEPGRIERILVGLFHERGGDLEARIVSEEPTKEFYTPAMYQFSTDPGRIEQFLNTVFQERGEQEFKTVPESFVDIFYLPGSNMDAFRRRNTQDHVPLEPAPEVISKKPSK
ncbi:MULTISPECIES: hypothetical protein [Haloarcula]|uniref:hypothetical protein n=1 Tax=Haloarcula TaxID=2237 RepID=UPI0023EDAA7F|nr:hypothetical protein [Halomicroarcula sp. XH51]